MVHKIIKITRSDPAYFDGLNYLLRQGLRASSMRTAYEGNSTVNLALCSKYERAGVVDFDVSWQDRPDRYIMFSDKGVTGVLVCITLPEFKLEINNETFIILDADDSESYSTLLEYAITHSVILEKLELVNFRPEHIHWLEKVNLHRNLEDIHEWHVYIPGNKYYDPEECKNVSSYH